MHELLSIVLKNHHLKVVSCISSLFGIHAMLCGKMAENFTHPPAPPSPRPQGKCCGRVGGWRKAHTVKGIQTREKVRVH
jgi:hypothetical protein